MCPVRESYILLACKYIGVHGPVYKLLIAVCDTSGAVCWDGQGWTMDVLCVRGRGGGSRLVRLGASLIKDRLSDSRQMSSAVLCRPDAWTPGILVHAWCQPVCVCVFGLLTSGHQRQATTERPPTTMSCTIQLAVAHTHTQYSLSLYGLHYSAPFHYWLSLSRFIWSVNVFLLKIHENNRLFLHCWRFGLRQR